MHYPDRPTAPATRRRSRMRTTTIHVPSPAGPAIVLTIAVLAVLAAVIHRDLDDADPVQTITVLTSGAILTQPASYGSGQLMITCAGPNDVFSVAYIEDTDGPTRSTGTPATPVMTDNAGNGWSPSITVGMHLDPDPGGTVRQLRRHRTTALTLNAGPATPLAVFRLDSRMDRRLLGHYTRKCAT